MNIYVPYTYSLHHKPTGLLYYGVRYAKNCNPNDLWVTYFTSSRHVKKLISEYGSDSFEYRIRRTFDNRETAVGWETKMLKRIDAASNPRMINRTNGIGTYVPNSGCWGPCKESRRQAISRAHKGKKASPEHIAKMMEGKRNYIITQEHRDKLSKSLRGLKKPKSFSDKLSVRHESKMTKLWKIINVDGSFTIIKNINKYALENGISPPKLHRVARGERTHHKGIRIELFSDSTALSD